jgi:hypothetical protein
MNDARLRVDAVMGDIERDVRDRLRRHLLKKGGAAQYQEQEIFDAVHQLFARVIDSRDLDASLPSELFDDDVDWRLQTHLKLTTHRPAAAGRLILFAKKKLLLPLTRWLFEYSQENFRRQDRLNRILFACIEELAIENARLRRDVESASAGKTAR